MFGLDAAISIEENGVQMKDIEELLEDASWALITASDDNDDAYQKIYDELMVSDGDCLWYCSGDEAKAVFLLLQVCEDHGVEVDYQIVANKADGEAVLENAAIIEAHGAKIDYDELFYELSGGWDTSYNCQAMLKYDSVWAQHGVEVDYNEVYRYLFDPDSEYPEGTVQLAELIERHGVEVDYQALADTLLENNRIDTIYDGLTILLAHGVQGLPYRDICRYARSREAEKRL